MFAFQICGAGAVGKVIKSNYSFLQLQEV